MALRTFGQTISGLQSLGGSPEALESCGISYPSSIRCVANESQGLRARFAFAPRLQTRAVIRAPAALDCQSNVPSKDAPRKRVAGLCPRRVRVFAKAETVCA